MAGEPYLGSLEELGQMLASAICSDAIDRGHHAECDPPEYDDDDCDSVSFAFEYGGRTFYLQVRDIE